MQDNLGKGEKNKEHNLLGFISVTTTTGFKCFVGLMSQIFVPDPSAHHFIGLSFFAVDMFLLKAPPLLRLNVFGVFGMGEGAPKNNH